MFICDSISESKKIAIDRHGENLYYLNMKIKLENIFIGWNCVQDLHLPMQEQKLVVSATQDT
jgi:hypothetical protein